MKLSNAERLFRTVREHSWMVVDTNTRALGICASTDGRVGIAIREAKKKALIILDLDEIPNVCMALMDAVYRANVEVRTRNGEQLAKGAIQKAVKGGVQ